MSPLRRTRERGVALVMALALMVVVAGIVTLMFARTLGEIQHSADDAGIVQSLMLARGVANVGATVMAETVKGELSDIVADTSSTVNSWSYGTSSSGADAPKANTVVSALAGSGGVADRLQAVIDNLLCGETVSPGGGGTGTIRVFVTDTACGTEALPDKVRLPGPRFVSGNSRSGEGSAEPQTYALPYVMVATGSLGAYNRNVVVQGEYRFEVGRGSFAKYALFTNEHETANGSDIWFTENTLFDGPVHTNQYFRFFYNPWFGDKVTSAGCENPGNSSCPSNGFTKKGADFYAKGYFSSGQMSPSQQKPSYKNGNRWDAPDLAGGVDWGANFVPLPGNSQDQKQAAQGAGLYLDGNVSSLKMWAADASGAELSRKADGTWTPAATYQYIEACVAPDKKWMTDVCTTYRYQAGGDLMAQDPTTMAWSVAQAAFNGVIFSPDNISHLRGPKRQSGHGDDPTYAPPALASFAQITIAADNGMTITSDLKYEDRPCSGAPERKGDGTVTPATCDNLNAKNVLGLYSQGKDILIGNNQSSSDDNAPQDVTIDAVMMSGRGMVRVQDYNHGNARGTVNLTGGIIEYNYGAFGTFNTSNGSMSTGYSRSFTYDRRMKQGLSPPYFPTVGEDKVQNVMIFSFGQREQLQ